MHGNGPRTYGSDLPLARAQLAALAVRIHEHVTGIAPEAAPDHFTDDDGHTLEPAMNIAADLGIVLGTGPGTFAPNAAIRRDQTASILVHLFAELSATLSS